MPFFVKKELLRFWGIEKLLSVEKFHVYSKKTMKQFFTQLKKIGHSYVPGRYNNKDYPEFTQQIEVFDRRGKSKGIPILLLEDGTTRGYFIIIKNSKGNVIGFFIIGEDKPTLLHEIGHLKDELEIKELIKNFKDVTIKIASWESEIYSQNEEKYQFVHNLLHFILENYSINTRMLKKGVTHPYRVESPNRLVQNYDKQSNLIKIQQIVCGTAILILEHYNYKLDSSENLRSKYPLIRNIIEYLRKPIKDLYGKMLSVEICQEIVNQIEKSLKNLDP